MPEVAVPIAASVAGDVVKGAISGGANDDALQAQQQAGDKALALQEKMYNTSRADLAPYRNTGIAANQKLSNLMGLGEINRDSVRADLLNRFPTLFKAKEATPTPAAPITSSGGPSSTGGWGYRGTTNMPMNAVEAAQPGGAMSLFQSIGGSSYGDPEVQKAIQDYQSTGGTDYKKVIDAINKRRMGA